MLAVRASGDEGVSTPELEGVSLHPWPHRRVCFAFPPLRRRFDATAVTLLDYGAGNVRSVRNAIRHLGFSICDVRSPEDILAADRLVFPGSGAFSSAMDVLTRSGMANALREYIRRDCPFLGICLGLQLLFDSSEENGPSKAPFRSRLFVSLIANMFHF
ncbi:hypothetical protein OsI_13545 [Oryza sativa Indica Group]|uniref:Glutamine amidotransferase/cyclase n=3 Tax=Oryza sativa TaxID=4530 RepID=A3AMT0_ORYSJ|nr:putative glutamine amidotransferase/cyclase [Oryza sativa Japonica Group]EAY91895.1 hypothetical protein OsI_13545 [Oryza sativa Indica Group]ABF98933.1 Imidazole glycerol phosphate synthase hisHF, chloroplast precursor, putative [Oryza sativa Japonica Group]EAZ28619.1 hypothetical protein OsJ_12605 [Oryza sativa Japonica Group]KAF2941378.1 hypothetical protein DAI22_03g342200 [Oryza sativa Japonica Group]|eukprot:NP_001173644.1 Os03g0753901 [Oryza sativa Japonica Group]